MELNYTGSGKVYFNDQEYRCDLYINENEGGILININIAKALASFFDLPMNIDFLVGELSTGFKFSLINCERQGMSNNISEGRSVYTYHSKYLVKGLGEKTDKRLELSRMNFRVANILAWGGISAYKISDKFELSHNSDVKKEVYKNDEFVIEYWVSNSRLPVVSHRLLKENIVLNQSGNIEITFKNEESIDKFVEIFNKIKRLMELSTLRNIYPSKLTGVSNNVYYMYDKKKVERPIEIISCDLNNEESKVDYIETMKWINLSELIDNDSFSKYFLKYEMFEPVIELYLEIIYSKTISNRRVFLNIVQALETYHSRFKTNNLSDFKERIKTKILNNRSKEWIEEDTTFLIANSYKFITLESRLADLLLAEFQIHFDTGDIKYYDFPKVIANTRNYYIHYDEAIKERSRVLTESELSIYNRSLLYILEYYILVELGFTDRLKIIKKLNERWGRISETLSIIKCSNENTKKEIK
ncbi:HEPN domain-containing protein [uncultured Clostridium sp.]|uniref:ApeA N-terminal domain 1-containing protein n=1 Tax=uncultured Clostridium sp. TaxID=59620 RepID=UPI0025829FEE|nr:HEPN domain-containing protein [uncultured Clostridium sp.]